MGRLAQKLWSALRRLLRVLSRPVRHSSSRSGVVIQPYRGYGSSREVFLIGRIFRQPDKTRHKLDQLSSDLLDVGRRLLRRGIADAAVTASFCGSRTDVRTDRDGYFRVHMDLERAPPAGRFWHEVKLELTSPQSLHSKAMVYVPPESSRYVVISDIDDTVIHTGVGNKILMLWRMFVLGAESRVGFPGVAALYRAFHRGASGEDHNLVLYVSRGPWTIYEILDEFFNEHRIPVGPILFLREWGVRWKRPFPRRAKGHKLSLIRNMLPLFPDKPIVLVGDSGQHDPEIYHQIVHDNPGRVLAVYIRNVSSKTERHDAIDALAKEVVAAGSHLVLAPDSLAVARHAAEVGLIEPEMVAAVEREMQGEPPPDYATRDPSRFGDEELFEVGSTVRHKAGADGAAASAEEYGSESEQRAVVIATDGDGEPSGRRDGERREQRQASERERIESP